MEKTLAALAAFLLLCHRAGRNRHVVDCGAPFRQICWRFLGAIPTDLLAVPSLLNPGTTSPRGYASPHGAYLSQPIRLRLAALWLLFRQIHRYPREVGLRTGQWPKSRRLRRREEAALFATYSADTFALAASLRFDHRRVGLKCQSTFADTVSIGLALPCQSCSPPTIDPRRPQCP